MHVTNAVACRGSRAGFRTWFDHRWTHGCLELSRGRVLEDDDATMNRLPSWLRQLLRTLAERKLVACIEIAAHDEDHNYIQIEVERANYSDITECLAVMVQAAEDLAGYSSGDNDSLECRWLAALQHMALAAG